MWRTAALVLAGFAMACGGGDTPTSPTRPSDPSALTISCPATVTTQAQANAPLQLAPPQATASGGTAPVSVACQAPADNLFPIGTTRVTCTATDGRSQTASCGFDVVVQPPPPRLAKTEFMAFGDSITAGEVTVPVGVGTRDELGFPAFGLVVVPAASYPTQLLTLLRGRYTADAGRIAVSNLGKPGEYTDDATRRFPDAYALSRPQVVLLMEGANDLEALGTRGPPVISSNIDAMARYALQQGSDVFIATLTPSKAGGRLSLPESLLTTTNDRLRNVAAARGATFVDVYTPLLADLGTFIGVDGLHPTEAGYRRMAEVFFDAIRARYEVPAR